MNEQKRIGIDLGGTKIEGVVLSGPRDEPEALNRKRIPTEADKGYDRLTQGVVDFIDELARDAGLARPLRLGFGMPGGLTRDGLVKNSNAVCLNGTRFRDDVAERLGQTVAFANDANCFALAEAVMGAGRGHDLVFGVIMGTGVGGGIVIEGQIREGPQFLSGEWGHAVLRPDSDRACYCGKFGCVEDYLAGPWVERHYAELGGVLIKLPEIVKRRDEGDAIAVRVITEWLDNFGLALANVINVIDPDVVILGGGLSKIECLYDEGRERVARYVSNNELLTPIVPNQLGDSAGVFGAALLC